MNKRIEELAELSGFKQDALNMGIWYSPEFQKFAEQFAESIVRDCANYAFSDDQERNAMLAHFSVEEPKEFEVWICEKCGADRTKEPCQLAVEGKVVYGNCPIIRVAQ